VHEIKVSAVHWNQRSTRNSIFFRASGAASASITMKPFAGEKMEV